MKRGPVVLGVGLVTTAVLVGVLASGFQHDPHSIASPLIDKPAPDFALPTLEPGPSGAAETFSLKAQRGTPVVVNFWATWCVPCQEEHPTMLALARALGDKVRFRGIIYQDKPELIDNFLNARGRAYPTLIDTASQTAIAFGVYGVPETFVIDKKGVIREKYTGGVSYAGMMQLLDTLLAEAG